MDRREYFEIWSLLSSNSIETIKQFQSIIDLIYEKMIIMMRDVNDNSNNNDCILNMNVNNNNLEREIIMRRKYNLREIKKMSW